MQRGIKLLVGALVLVACRPEHTPASRQDRWWVPTCGPMQPLGVMGGHDIVPPVLLERVEPRWPRAKTRGVIIIETVLTDDGRVCAARIVRGLGEEMNVAALEAVKQWRFTPVKLNGEPRPAFYGVGVPVN